MKIDLIVIGNELLNGKTQDINTIFLAKLLTKNGLTLRQVKIIEDNQDSFSQAIDSSLEAADVVITTGGLGPTKDDLTKTMLAHYFHKDISFDQKALDITLEHFTRYNREYDEQTMHYHKIPKDFSALLNPTGYAPGLMHELKSEQLIFSLPGVPLEFQSMLESQVLSHIESKSKNELFIEYLTIKTWKLPESKIFNDIVPGLWEQLLKYGDVSSLPHPLGVDIGIKLTCATQQGLTKQKTEILSLLNSTSLKENIWHIGNLNLEELIVKEAKEKKLTIGFAESCTGGLCASRITNVSGSSSIFWGSIVSYANEVKIKSLNVSKETLDNHGAVSEQTALEMSLGAQKNLQVDIAISTTGIAGPNGGSAEKPVGTVGIGIASKKTQASQIYNFNGNREMLKVRFSQIALMTLLEEIRKL